MRTFLNVDRFNIYEPFGLESDSWLLQLQMRCLRVLSFNQFSIELLPDSIGKLIHLHYLDLSLTPIVELSESLCELYNLQTLKLNYCRKLRMLPRRMQDLVNLHHLDIRGANLLKEMPNGMSELKHLNFLSDYIVVKHEENGIRELGTLDNLNGSLCISNLENVNSSSEASEAKIGNKKYINILELKWDTYGEINIDDLEKERDILDGLQPHENVKELSIEGYKGKIFPDWLGLSRYSNITKLSMNGCKNCCQLPSLGQLPSLQHLKISELDGLEKIGCEFYKNNESRQQETPFKFLESLKFQSMSRWREWHFLDEFDCFPKLRRLSLEECPVLSGDLPAHLSSLEKLTIHQCEELACSFPRAPKLLQLNVTGHMGIDLGERIVCIVDTQLAKSALECLPHIQAPRIQNLNIWSCWSVMSISGDHLPTSLQYLSIVDCSKLTFSEPLQHKSLAEIEVYNSDSPTLLPLGSLPNLKTLKITDFRRLVSMPALGSAAPHIENLEIEECPEMDSFGEDCLPPSLTTLRISGCEKLERLITSKGLHAEGLTHLILAEWNEVKSFPIEDCLPASLQSLQLCRFPNLETLDCDGLHHLTSLKELIIEECPTLENITHERLPPSIEKLSISGVCPLWWKLKEMNDPRIQLER